MGKYLIYVKPVCRNVDGTYEYDFYFSENTEIVWGEDWDYSNPSICNDTTPEKTTYSLIERVISPFPLKTIQETSCYSMEYAIYNIIALSWIDIESLEDYPENGRCTLYFGEEYDAVINKLNKSKIIIDKK